MTRVVSEYGEELMSVLRGGGVAVMRTDTIYGIVCLADNEQAVARIYALKHRTDTKSPIVLIADMSQLYEPVTPAVAISLDTIWPGPYSVILASTQAPKWIARDNGSVAYRMPARDDLRHLLAQTGPLVAPSANTEGNPPAATIAEAIDYFGEQVNIYVDGGSVSDAQPSTILRLADDAFERVR